MTALTALIHTLTGAVRFVLHFDTRLEGFLQLYGNWTYAILAGIVFCETGLVVTPILPGDSLLFAVGAFAARGALSLPIAYAILCLAAVSGDLVNYTIGYNVGPKSVERGFRWVRREYVERTQHFFARYGRKTIVLARFVPIVRTFSPFLAGVGRMPLGTFLTFSIAGGAFWVAVCLSAGYFFGNLEIVRKNFSLVVLGIIAVSLVPAAVEWFRGRSASAAAGGRVVGERGQVSR
jgi:membrane-associated protein